MKTYTRFGSTSEAEASSPPILFLLASKVIEAFSAEIFQLPGVDMQVWRQLAQEWILDSGSLIHGSWGTGVYFAASWVSRGHCSSDHGSRSKCLILGATYSMRC